jgi:myosin heavy subunit
MLETVRIRKAGFGMRFPFAEFFQRYKVLHPVLIRQKGDGAKLCGILTISQIFCAIF